MQNFRFHVILKTITKTLACLGYVFGVLAIAGCLISLLGKWHYLLEIPTHFRIQASIGIFLLAIILLFTAKSKWFSTTLILFSFFWCYPLIKYYTPIKHDPIKTSATLLLHNVHTKNQQYKKVIQSIKSTDPDFVILLEVNQQWKQHIDQLAEHFPYSIQQVRDDFFGIVVLSKHPFSSKNIATWGPMNHPSVDFSVHLNNKALRVIGIHSTTPTTDVGWRAQRTFFKELAEAVANNSTPTIVAGDFNTSPWSSSFTSLLEATQLREAAMGHGILPTWSRYSKLLAIPIDHVLVSRKVGINEYTVGSNQGSDHRAVITKLYLID